MPLVSVIVPMYGVETYLPDCLRSLADQSLTDVQFVLVDDDSPDGSAEIAQRFVEQDRRFSYVHQENRGPGPGGGRNGGLASAGGRYIIFVDGDDVVAPNALRDMVEAADIADADLVTGNTVRLVGGSIRRSEFHDLSHPVDVERTTAIESPWLMFDPTPWNKLFRRSFFDQTLGEWPEKVLYEDIYAMTKSHLCSRATAVLSDDLYFWRIRAEEGAITGVTTSIVGDRAQLRELRRAAELVQTTGSGELFAWFSWKALCFDLHWMTRKLSRVSSQDATTLAADMRDTIASLDQGVRQRLPDRTQRSYRWLEEHRQSAWRAKIGLLNGRLSAVSRSFAVANSVRDPAASLQSWTPKGPGATLTVSVNCDQAPGDWWLDLADRSLVGTEPPLPLLSIHGREQSSVRPTTTVVTFEVDFRARELMESGPLLRCAVRNDSAGLLGEIGRSFQDRIRSRIQPARVVATGTATAVPFVDNDRFMIAIDQPALSVTNVQLDAEAVTVSLGSEIADRFDGIALHATNKHEPLVFDRIDATTFAFATLQILDFFAEGRKLLFLAGRPSESPAVPHPLVGVESAQARATVRGVDVEVVLANYGQVVIRPFHTPIDEVREMVGFVRKNKYVRGL